MDAETVDAGVSRIAAAIAEPARTRMLYCLMDGRARTSTELAAVADVSSATASAHLARLSVTTRGRQELKRRFDLDVTRRLAEVER